MAGLGRGPSRRPGRRARHRSALDPPGGGGRGRPRRAPHRDRDGDGIGQVPRRVAARPHGPPRGAPGHGALHRPDEGPRPRPGPVAGRLGPARHPGRGLRRGHPGGGTPVDPGARQCRAHQSRSPPLLHAPPPRHVVEVPARTRLCHRRRGAPVPRRVRLARGTGAAPAPAHGGPLRGTAHRGARLGHDGRSPRNGGSPARTRCQPGRHRRHRRRRRAAGGPHGGAVAATRARRRPPLGDRRDGRPARRPRRGRHPDPRLHPLPARGRDGGAARPRWPRRQRCRPLPADRRLSRWLPARGAPGPRG